MRPRARARAESPAVISGLQEGWTPAERTLAPRRPMGLQCQDQPTTRRPGSPPPRRTETPRPPIISHHFSKKPDLSPSISGPVRQKAAPVRREGSLSHALKLQDDTFVSYSTATKRRGGRHAAAAQPAPGHGRRGPPHGDRVPPRRRGLRGGGR